MQSRFIADIPYLHLRETCTVKFLDAVICNQLPSREIINPHFVAAFGSMAILQIESSGLLIYSIVEDDTVFGSIDAQEIFQKYMGDFKLSIKALDMFLWFVKDTCAFATKAYGVGAQMMEDKNIVNGTISFALMYSNSAGEYKPSHFTFREIEDCKQIMNKLFDICPEFKNELRAREIDYTRDENRIEKSLKFVKAARGAEFLRAKLAMYMSALECLFSGQSSGELMFKVSIRTAYYLGVDRSDRVSISSTIVAAYEVRSKYLHGGKPKVDEKTKNALTELSQKIDDIVRKVLTKVIMQDSEIFLPAPDTASKEEQNLKNEEFEKFLKDLTYPKNIQ